MEQAEIVARALWQHKTTQLRVISYALAGEDGEDRAASRTSRDTIAPSGGDRDSTTERRGRWNLARRAADGTIVPIKPKQTPEQEQAQKEQALTRLFGAHRANARLHGKGGKSPVKVISPNDPDGDIGRMIEQLNQLPGPVPDEEG